MYQIYQFDGLEFDDYLIPGDEQDMGTGAALTRFMPLPGGGFYDMFRSKRSPQGIRPITKSYQLWADTGQELREKLDAIRAKIGVRGKLTIRYDDGPLRWQWARMQNVSAPRAENAKNNFLPVEITWITAAQNWYGVVQGEGWTWGDGSWEWGDGTAGFGQNSFLFDITSQTQTRTLIHDSNINVSNLRVTFTGKTGAGNLIMRNEETGQDFLWNTTFAADDRLVIDTGARSIYLYQDSAQQNITTLLKRRDHIEVITTAAHGLAVGHFVAIEGTENYDGIFKVVTVPSATTVRVEIDPELYDARRQDNKGTLTRVFEHYDNTTIFDPKRWITLLPGNNGIQLFWDDYVAGMTVLFEWYDHLG